MLRMILAVAAVVIGVGTAAPAAAQTCGTFTLVGTFIMTIGGVNAAGRDVTMLASVTLSQTNALGIGVMSGAMSVNERGSALHEVSIASTYQLFANCVVYLFLPDGGRTATLTGIALDTARFIPLASVFDPAVQLTGTAQKFP